jgi:hypothetical protein
MKYSIEMGFVSSCDEANELFVYISVTSVIMQLMTQTLLWTSDIPVMGRPSTSHMHMEFEISEAVNEASDDDTMGQCSSCDDSDFDDDYTN